MGKPPIVPKQFFIAHPVAQGAKVQFVARKTTSGKLTLWQSLQNTKTISSFN